MRILFCIPTTQLSGGVKIIFEIAQGLAARGDTVHVFSYAGAPKWFHLGVPLIEAKDFGEIEYSNYDWVVASNAFMLPMLLPHLSRTNGRTRGLFFALDYESFHHSSTPTYEGFMERSATFDKLYQLPVPIIAESRAVQTLIKELVDVTSYAIPVGLDKKVFHPRPRTLSPTHKRILMVGNYLMPYKGMNDGLAALRLLAEKWSVQLVLISQESRRRDIFADLPYPVEIHFRPTEDFVPQIMATCDAYVCTSWYEGLGLPALESFCVGLPVVSTRTYGVSDYGVDGENLLLANPNNAPDLAEKLDRLLSDRVLVEHLRQNGFQTVENNYEWPISIELFRRALQEIGQTYKGCGQIDEREMQSLLDDLEREGDLTPIEVFRQFQTWAAELKDLCAQMLESGAASETQSHRVLELSAAFARYTQNPRAEYYDAFKTKVDLCRLILGFKDNPKFGEYLRLVLSREQKNGNPSSPSFSEIQYPVAKP